MYQRILVPVDGSPTSNGGLAEAIKLAKRAGARVRVLHVVDEMPFLMGADSFAARPGDVVTMLKEAGQTVLEQARLTVPVLLVRATAPEGDHTTSTHSTQTRSEPA
jgi:nucleotide-binding universal stress UspA family protein